MHTEIKGIHFEVPSELKDHIEKKLHKLDAFKDIIVDILFTINHEKHGYIVEANLNFRWGAKANLQVEKHDLHEALELLFDKIIHKVTKEKEKIKEH